MATSCIPSVIKANHNMGWHLVYLVSPVRWEITIISASVVSTKGITIASTNHVVKLLVEALTSYYNFLMFLLLFVAVFIINKVVALHKLRHPIH